MNIYVHFSGCLSISLPDLYVKSKMAAIWSRDLVSIATDIQQTLILSQSPFKVKQSNFHRCKNSQGYFQSLAFFRCVAQRTKWRECVLYMWGK